MTTRITNGAAESNRDILSQVHQGMSIFNNEGDRIATVDAVSFGTISGESLESSNVPATNERPIMPPEVFGKIIRNLFDPGEIPDEVAERLRYSGFVRIEGGLFGNDRYIVPDQIDYVADDGIHLKVPEATAVEEI